MALIPHYEQNVSGLVSQYESLSFEDVHASLLDLLPAPGATVLDIGAGSGRDAAWFAAHGYDVVAVEPSDAMLAHARQLHPSNQIHWLSDSLPDLAKVQRLGLNFDLILLSAVWMHIPPASRQRSLRKLATLLASKGRIAISLRLGTPDAQRSMHAVSMQELSSLALQFGLRVVRTTDSQDRLGRSDPGHARQISALACQRQADLRDLPAPPTRLDAFLSQGDERGRRFFLEASQTLPVLASSPGTADIIDAMRLHRIRLSKDQGLRPWEPLDSAALVRTGLPSL